MEILESITVSPDLGEIREKLHIVKDEEMAFVGDLIESAWPVIEPKAAYKACAVTSTHEDNVTLDHTCFKSRVLRQQLEQSEQVFPYVVTIGQKLEDKIRASGDILEQYYLDVIGNVALYAALNSLEEHIKLQYDFHCISSMAPGSLEDWPLVEQGPLFSTLGDVKSAIGVRLTKAFLMLPTKSESGIFFPTSTKFYSCQLCPREDCANRKADYNEKDAAEIPKLSMMGKIDKTCN